MYVFMYVSIFLCLFSPSDFEISSWTRSPKSKRWAIRVLVYGCLNGKIIQTLPTSGTLVTGRHNDSALFDFIHCTNVENINTLLPISMYLFMFL